jgi:CRP/FNR family transcriptional regulator, anaerobic regulatory protein
MQSALKHAAPQDLAFETAESRSNYSGRYQWPMAMGAMLFQPGQPRRLYRIESGAICHYMRPANGQPQVIEFAFPGDIIGLGHSPTHASTAKAMIDTVVGVITDAEFETALRDDNKLFFRLAEAGEREFDYFRNRSLEGDLYARA